jgi:lysophospholipase L1-like esterase
MTATMTTHNFRRSTATGRRRNRHSLLLLVGAITFSLQGGLRLNLAVAETTAAANDNPAPKTVVGGASDKPIDPALVPVEEDAKLPRVLLIGDSISMGYTPALRELLKGKANLQHPTQNCGPSSRIVSNLDQYLGKKPWDVIQFNCGIHDLTYMDEARKPTSPTQGGKPQVPLDEYRSNLEKIVVRLKKTGAKLIWCTTTPIKSPADYRIPTDVDLYNDAAKQVMRHHEIEITDLHGQILQHGAPKWDAGGVHFTADGSRELASWVAPAIEKALPSLHQ